MGNAAHGSNYINAEKGLMSWFTSLDHKRIGILYFCTVLFFFLCGGIAALLLRLELFTPNTAANVGQVFSNGDVYNQVLTYHGAIMVFMVIVPGIPSIFGNFFLQILFISIFLLVKFVVSLHLSPFNFALPFAI